MRLAAISDTHGNAVAFRAVIADLRKQSPDAVVCLGDIVMRGPQPKECLEMLHALKPLRTVRGNFDHRFTRWPEPNWTPQSVDDELKLRDFLYTRGHLTAQDQEWLANQPVETSLQIEGVGVELYHAAPGSINRYTWPCAPVDELAQLRVDPGTQVVLFGHMHHAFVRTAKGFTVVNPGSVGLPFDGDNRASYAIIEIGGEGIAAQIRRVPYDVEASIRMAEQLGMPDAGLFAQGLRQAEFPYPAK